MNCLASLGLALTVFCGAVAEAPRAQTLFDGALPFGDVPPVTSVPFVVDTDGNLTVTVTDPGIPAALAELHVAVVRGSELVLRVAGPAGGTFDALAGDYRLLIVGVPTTASTVGSAFVRVTESSGGSTVFETLRAFELPSPPVTSPAAFEHTIAITTPDTYELEITDFALPAALQSLDTIVLPQGGVPVGQRSWAGTISFAATAGTYEVFVLAELAASVERGLVGLSLRRSGGETEFSALDEIGEWPYQYPFDVVSATTLTSTFTDFAFPQPLASFGSVLAGGGRLIGRATGTGTVSSAVSAGSYIAYVDAEPPSATTPGSFGVLIADASAARLVDVVQSVVPAPAPTDVEAIDTGFDIVAAGDYSLTLTDFGLSGFFVPFTSVTLALTKGPQIIDTLDAPGNFVFAATPGRYSLAIIADPAGTEGKGLLGIEVRGGPSSAAVYEETAAVGSDFISEHVTVTGNVSVDVTATDLGFPADFESMRIAVTRGAARAGEILGEGSFSFDATQGTYHVSVLATPDSATGHSTLGLNVQVTPPIPTLTLTASATTVVVGGSATLTWSATDATGCTASGSWSGTRTVSGTQSVGPLNTVSTYTLTCTGPGGSQGATVTIDLTPEQRSGGGSVELLTLVVLGLLLAFGRPRPTPAIRRATLHESVICTPRRLHSRSLRCPHAGPADNLRQSLLLS